MVLKVQLNLDDLTAFTCCEIIKFDQMPKNTFFVSSNQNLERKDQNKRFESPTN